MGRRVSHLIIASLVIVAAILAVYFQTLHYPFVFDDHYYIVDEARVKSLSGFWPPSGTRYFGFLTFALNYHLGGLDTLGYHIVNTAIHAANSLLVFSLILLVFRTPFMEEAQKREQVRGLGFAVALSSALIFAVHPLNTQAVTYITQRFASLAAFFYLLSVVLYIRARLYGIGFRSIFFLAVSIFAAVCAMKTKEISFTLPFMIALTEFTFFTGSLRKKLLYLAPILLTLLVIPLSKIDGTPPPAIAEEASTRLEYLFTEFRVIVTYLRLLVLPIEQALDYDYRSYTSFFVTPVWASFLFLASIFGMGVYLITRKTVLRLAGFGIIWFFLAISIESSVIPLLRDFIFEHRVYLPGIGAFVAFSTTVFLFIARCRISFAMPAIAVIAMVSAPLAYVAFQRNLVWKTQISVWEDTVAKHPEKARSRYNLGSLYAEEGRMVEAKREFEKAIEIRPGFSKPHNNLGNIYYSEGRFEEAAREYKLAAELDQANVEALYNLGNVYMVLNRKGEATEAFTRFIEKASSEFEQQKREAGESIIQMGGR